MPNLIRSCVDCRTDFIQGTHWGRPEERCPACKPIHKANLKRAYHLSPHNQALRRAAKSRRRARIRGVEHEAIDPIAVFERDHWRCHLCKAKTAKAKRGTCDSRAPELDHIVSLADGGSHTWSNVACACRACNCTKGAKSMGQLGLALTA